MRSMIFLCVAFLLAACEGGNPYETAFDVNERELAEGCERFCSDTIVGDDVYLGCDVRKEDAKAGYAGSECDFRFICKYRTPYRASDLH